MLGRLVQGLDLGDEEELVAAGHGHAQDQLEEPGHHSGQYFANSLTIDKIYELSTVSSFR